MPEISARAAATPAPPATGPRRFTLRQRIVLRIIIWLGYWIIRLIGPTLRVCISREEGAQETLEQRPLIGSFWHSCLIPATYICRDLGVRVMSSNSYDGEYMGRIIHKFGFVAVKGSSSRNAVRALLDVPGATLLMLPRLLVDEAFRVQLVEHHVGDPVVRSFWQNEYAGYSDHFRTEAISPIQNKIGKALIEPRLRNMLAQPKSTITLRRLMDEGAIVICNLSKGRLGEGVANLLGALLTTTIAQAALSRADVPAVDRRVSV